MPKENNSQTSKEKLGDYDIEYVNQWFCIYHISTV